MKHPFIVAILISGAAFQQSQAQTTASQPIYEDPYLYCRKFGSVDRPGPRYKGPNVVPEIASALQIQPKDYPHVLWRCMEGALLACNNLASPSCSKKTEPSKEASDYCKANPDSETVPNSQSLWSCGSGVPKFREIGTVDARGFDPKAWKRVEQADLNLKPPLATASTDTSPNSTECVFRDALARELLTSVNKGTDAAQDSDEILEAIASLTAKAVKQDLPIVQQLSQADAVTFQTLRQRLAMPQIFALLERRRLRDLEVVNKMVALADQSFHYGVEPSESDPDGRILASLRLIRSSLEQKPVKISPAQNSCNVDTAIASMQNETYRKVERLDLKAVNALAEQLKSQYKMQGRIEREKLEPGDREKWDSVVRTIVLPSDRAKNYMLDLEASRIALLASNILYESDYQDARSSKGNIEVVGLSIQKRVESNEFEPATLAAMGLWRLLNETDITKPGSSAQ